MDSILFGHAADFNSLGFGVRGWDGMEWYWKAMGPWSLIRNGFLWRCVQNTTPSHRLDGLHWGEGFGFEDADPSAGADATGTLDLWNDLYVVKEGLYSYSIEKISKETRRDSRALTVRCTREDHPRDLSTPAVYMCKFVVQHSSHILNPQARVYSEYITQRGMQ